MISEEQEVSLTTRKTKGAKGGGTIRQRPDGRWEARYTLGIDPGTGKQIQKSVYGKTQKEVRQKLTAITAEIDSGMFTQEPCKMTVNEWLDIWLKDYQIGVKDSTAYLYERQAKLYLRPALGNIPLETLKAHAVQRLYNSLSQEHDGQPALSAKTIKNIHGVLHKALKQAVLIGYLRTNPTEACILPRIIRKEMHPLEEDQVAVFLREVQGHSHEYLYKIALFTGLREGEVLGLGWEHIDFQAGTLTVKRQLRREQKKGGAKQYENGGRRCMGRARPHIHQPNRRLSVLSNCVRLLQAYRPKHRRTGHALPRSASHLRRCLYQERRRH